MSTQSTPKNGTALLTGEDRILTTPEVADLLRLKPATLEKARSTSLGNYPPYIRLGGRRIGYRLSAVEAWLRSNSVDDSRWLNSPQGV